MFVTSKEYYDSCGGLDNYTGNTMVYVGGYCEYTGEGGVFTALKGYTWYK